MTAQDLAELLMLLTAPLGLVGHIVGHLLATRLRPGLGILRAYFAGFPCGLAVFAAYALFVRSLHPADEAQLWALLADFIAFLGLSYTYFHFANMSYGARRNRLLREIASQADGLSPEQLVARYNAREMLDSRLDRLVASHQVRIENGRILGGQSAVRGMAACLGLIKLIIFGGRQRSDLPQGIDALRRAVAESRSKA